MKKYFVSVFRRQYKTAVVHYKILCKKHLLSIVIFHCRECLRTTTEK